MTKQNDFGMMPPPSRPPTTSTGGSDNSNNGDANGMMPLPWTHNNRSFSIGTVLASAPRSQSQDVPSSGIFGNLLRPTKRRHPLANDNHPSKRQQSIREFFTATSQPQSETSQGPLLEGSSLAVKEENEPHENVMAVDENSSNGGPSSKDDETHIIFAIDASGSMKKRDVLQTSQRTGKREKVRRWDAVFDCIQIFLQAQVQQQNNNAEHNNTCVVSLLIFNDQAQRVFHRLPLVGDGESVLQAVHTAHHDNHPHHGTNFSAGFQQAHDMASNRAGNVVLTFLSDGRPGDLRARPPMDETKAMQTAYKQNKKSFSAAGVYLEQMKKDFGDRFSLHLVCIYDEGRPWLDYLSKRYQGTFHNAELSMDVAEAPPKDSGPGQDDEEDEILEMKVKSQSTVIREKFNRAAASGNVLSIHGTTTATSTMRTTFESISSTVTAMRSKSRSVERQGIVLESAENPSALVPFPATRMVLDKNHEKILVPAGEASNGRKVSVARQPFAQGGLRNVYRMVEEKDDGRHVYLVGKESRHQVGYHERLKFHRETSSCQAKAIAYANAFNFALLSTNKASSKIKVLKAEVYRLKDTSVSSNYRYLAVEEHLPGSYEKYNSNNGYVNKSIKTHVLVAQAFSHFSFEHSNHEEMVVDIQGSGFSYTDPQLHSKTKSYGRADRGTNGFQDFFKTHKCNEFCRALRLKSHCIPALDIKPDIH